MSAAEGLTPKVHPLFQSAQFIEHDDINKLVKDLMKQTSPLDLDTITLEGQLNGREIASDRNILEKVFHGIAVVIQKIWHNVMMVVSESYSEKFINAARVITLKAIVNNDNEAKKQLEINFLELDIKKISADIQKTETDISNNSIAIANNLSEIESANLQIDEAVNDLTKVHTDREAAKVRFNAASRSLSSLDSKVTFHLNKDAKDQHNIALNSAKQEYAESKKEIISLFGKEAIIQPGMFSSVAKLDEKNTSVDGSIYFFAIAEAQTKYNKIGKQLERLDSEKTHLQSESVVLANKLQALQETLITKEEKLNQVSTKETTVEEQIQIGDLPYVGQEHAAPVIQTEAVKKVSSVKLTAQAEMLADISEETHSETAQNWQTSFRVQISLNPEKLMKISILR